MRQSAEWDLRDAADDEEPWADPEPPQPRRRSWFRRLLRPVVTLILLGLFALLVARLFLTANLMIPEASMAPAIPEGAEVLTWRPGTPEVGDVVLIRLQRGHIVRRVVAGPGSTVEQDSDGLIVDGQRLTRRPTPSATAPDCATYVEEIAGRPVDICVGNGSEDPLEEISLAGEEIYVRCDNRSFCALMHAPEGRASLDDVVGPVVFLMSLGDDSDRPFYERWFGRFDPVP